MAKCPLPFARISRRQNRCVFPSFTRLETNAAKLNIRQLLVCPHRFVLVSRLIAYLKKSVLLLSLNETYEKAYPAYLRPSMHESAAQICRVTKAEDFSPLKAYKKCSLLSIVSRPCQSATPEQNIKLASRKLFSSAIRQIVTRQSYLEVDG